MFTTVLRPLICLALVFLITSCTQQDVDTIYIENQWIREAPPNAGALAGYLTIHNSTSDDKKLTFAKSPHFNSIEIHLSIIEDGVARMRRQEELLIPAKGQLELKPGGYHLMLMAPKSEFKENDEIDITLCVFDGDKIEEIDIVIPVKKAN